MTQDNSRRHLHILPLNTSKNSDRNKYFLMPNTISFEKATVFLDFF